MSFVEASLIIVSRSSHPAKLIERGYNRMDVFQLQVGVQETLQEEILGFWYCPVRGHRCAGAESQKVVLVWGAAVADGFVFPARYFRRLESDVHSESIDRGMKDGGGDARSEPRSSAPCWRFQELRSHRRERVESLSCCFQSRREEWPHLLSRGSTKVPIVLAEINSFVVLCSLWSAAPETRKKLVCLFHLATFLSTLLRKRFKGVGAK